MMGLALFPHNDKITSLIKRTLLLGCFLGGVFALYSSSFTQSQYNPQCYHCPFLLFLSSFYLCVTSILPYSFLFRGVQMYTTLKMGCSKSNSTSFTFKRGPIIYMAQILRLKMIFFLLFSIETLQSFNFMSFLLVQRYM